VSQYDGLTLVQLLELMHELVMPEPLPWLPQTPGWWVLLGWLSAVLVLSVWFLLKRRRRNRYRREALVALKDINRQTELSPAESAQRIAALLKRTALAAYPRRDVAPLYGSAWAQFLTESANDDRQIADAAGLLADAAYRQDADGAALSDAARRWIRLHRA
jgi:cbb3-type cytochrome oxidase subunit 3